MAITVEYNNKNYTPTNNVVLLRRENRILGLEYPAISPCGKGQDVGSAEETIAMAGTIVCSLLSWKEPKSRIITVFVLRKNPRTPLVVRRPNHFLALYILSLSSFESCGRSHVFPLCLVSFQMMREPKEDPCH